MKKKLALILAAALACTFVSCGNKDDDDKNSSDKSSKISAEDSSDESSDKDTSDESSEDESSDSSSEESSDESSDSNASSAIENFAFGTVENGVYSSSFNGMSFAAPEGFEFASEEEILSMVNLGTDIVAGDKSDLYKELISKTTIYDMMAQNVATGEGVMIMYENLSAYGYNIDSFTIDDYIKAMESQFALAADSGVTYEATATSTVTLCGKEFTKCDYNCEVTAYNYTTKQSYYLSLENGLITGIIVSNGLAENDAAFYEACFSEYTA